MKKFHLNEVFKSKWFLAQTQFVPQRNTPWKPNAGCFVGCTAPPGTTAKTDNWWTFLIYVAKDDSPQSEINQIERVFVIDFIMTVKSHFSWPRSTTFDNQNQTDCKDRSRMSSILIRSKRPKWAFLLISPVQLYDHVKLCRISAIKIYL